MKTYTTKPAIRFSPKLPSRVVDIRTLPLGSGLLRTKITQYLGTGETIATHSYLYQGRILEASERLNPFSPAVVPLQRIRRAALPAQPFSINRNKTIFQIGFPIIETK